MSVLQTTYDKLKTQFDQLSEEYNRSSHCCVFGNSGLKTYNKTLKTEANKSKLENYQYKETIGQLQRANEKLQRTLQKANEKLQTALTALDF